MLGRASRRKSPLVLNIIGAKTILSESLRQFDMLPSELVFRITQAETEMRNALKAKPEEIPEQYEPQLKTLQEAYFEAMLERNGTLRIEQLGRGRVLSLIIG